MGNNSSHFFHRIICAAYKNNISVGGTVRPIEKWSRLTCFVTSNIFDPKYMGHNSSQNPMEWLEQDSNLSLWILTGVVTQYLRSLCHEDQILEVSFFHNICMMVFIRVHWILTGVVAKYFLWQSDGSYLVTPGRGFKSPIGFWLELSPV